MRPVNQADRLPTTPVVRSGALNALSGIAHGFMTRRGGVSRGDLASLNTGIGSDDDPAAVAENRARARDAVLPGSLLLGVYQVHGTACVTASEAWADADRPHADALVADRPGLLLGILTADCVPVLFADPVAQVVGAAHAGWKGALGGVTDRTMDAMIALGADPARVVAAIGPCIGRTSYEVDLTFRDRFCAADPANERYFIDGRAGHALFDIAAYVAARLAAAGVARIDMIDHDTCARAEEYFSYRRACLTGENGYGRQLSLIGLRG